VTVKEERHDAEGRVTNTTYPGGWTTSTLYSKGKGPSRNNRYMGRGLII
jgi:hypothetical protein